MIGWLLNTIWDIVWRPVFWILAPVLRLMGLNGKPKIEDVIEKKKGAEKCRKIEDILKTYPNDIIRSFGWDTGDETEAAEAILEESISDTERHHDLSKSLAKSMRQIRGYQKLCKQVEGLRLQQYNTRNEDHEKQLLRLWKLLKPNEELEDRKSDQWQSIGFQGDDPATDFRGMGLLGLQQLLFYAQFDVESCLRVFSLALHPAIGFPFAIAGISMSALCKELLQDELLKNHFYNAVDQPPLTIDHFHQVYCRVYTLFADFWLWSEPESVMEFNEVRRRFAQMLDVYLEKADANLITANIDTLLDCLPKGGTNE